METQELENNEIAIDTESDNSSSDGETEYSVDLSGRNAFIKLSGFNQKELRLIKNEIEDIIISKIRKMESIEDASDKSREETSVSYFKHYSIDKVGNKITLGETGVAEGWNIPLYQNEFQNMVGLPFSEDHTLRIRRPRQECFNCLSTSHRVSDCPVRVDPKRIELQRNYFNAQSVLSQEQSQLFSNRYTSDLDSKSYRGFTPGKLSEQLREALDIRPNQLPPFVYVMRKLGYPTGWLLEAQVKETKLSVVDGQQGEEAKSKEDGNEVKKEEIEQVEYDPDRIYTFPGFNEAPPSNVIDESENYGVRRYCADFSREKFLTTLNLKKRKIVKRRTLTKEVEKMAASEGEESSEGETTELEEGETNEKPVNSQETSLIENDEEIVDDNGETPIVDDANFTTPINRNKRRKAIIEQDELHGSVSKKIPGTPIIQNISGVDRVPTWENFSQNICDHRAFEMEASQTASLGNFQNIIELTREFKSKQQQASASPQ